MMRAVRRIQLAGGDGRLKPIYFDRWRMWAKLRKIFRYWLRFVDEKAAEKNNSAAWAFRKWKHQL